MMIRVVTAIFRIYGFSILVEPQFLTKHAKGERTYRL